MAVEISFACENEKTSEDRRIAENEYENDKTVVSYLLNISKTHDDIVIISIYYYYIATTMNQQQYLISCTWRSSLAYYVINIIRF